MMLSHVRIGEPRSKTQSPSFQASTSCLAVYSGRTCVGFLLLRGRQGIEGFDADDRSLGLFQDQKSAADAISVPVAAQAKSLKIRKCADVPG
jgi:hypothetical protein